ncbi:carbon monoxide dehydrogenase subunit G [Aureimonas sp. SK2]|uniref:CoxG family protein n=1 Tax=Aureimonas sp. SK2 TaxID=3015992 RepID=UPI002444CE7D|nr:carbon monoxide dehydrogenase subunit G [Aureimonas sp. SK2]
MDLKGEYRLPAPRETVWAMLNDPAVLRDCIPGCESLEMTGENEMAATVVAKIGPVKATFTGQVRLENIVAPESYSIVGEGKGGIAGFASGGADVHLADEGSETVLTYTVDAKVGGKIAQLGGRLVDSSAKKLAGQFFDNLAARVGGAQPAAEEA